MLNELATAIEDVGHWNWWAESADAVQLEFSGAQLALPPLSPELPPRPIDLVALRFFNPLSFAFLTRERDIAAVPPDWPDQLAADRLDQHVVSTGLSFGTLSFGERAIAAASFAIPHRAQPRIGQVPTLDQWSAAPARIIFWAGVVGAVVTSQSLAVATADGDLKLEAVPQLTAQWWKYWRLYWDRRGTARALPYDGRCEATIPILRP